MDILNFRNMYKFRFLITISTILLLMSCNLKKETDLSKEKNNKQMQNYIMNTGLSSKDYSDIKSYSPKEGLVPTPEIAFQIAEPILDHIYGREKIENQKPFSINIENEIWIIEGHLSQDMDGGVAYMEIRKSNGEILKVIHGK